MSYSMVDAVRRQLVRDALERHAAADALLRDYHGSMRTDLDAEQAAAVEKSAADVPQLVELAVEMEQELVGLREEWQRLLTENAARREAVLGLRDRLQRQAHASHAGTNPIATCTYNVCTELRLEFGRPFATSPGRQHWESTPSPDIDVMARLTGVEKGLAEVLKRLAQ
jgi:hypothetical protein